MTVRTNRPVGGVANSSNNAGVGLGANRLPAYQRIDWYLDLNGAETGAVTYTNPPGGLATDAAAGNFATGDQYLIMAIPKYTVIQGIQAINVTALTGITNYSIGDLTANSATFYVNAFSTLTAGAVATQAVTTNPLYFYGVAADQLLLKITGSSLSSATGILHVRIIVADMTPNPPTTENF